MRPTRKLDQLIQVNPGSRACQLRYIAICGKTRSNPTHSVNVMARNRLVAWPKAANETLDFIECLRAGMHTGPDLRRTCRGTPASRGGTHGLRASWCSPGRACPPYRKPDGGPSLARARPECRD